MAFDIDARHPGRFLIGADRIGVLAVNGETHDQLEDDGQQNEPDYWHHAGAQEFVGFGGEGDRATR